MSLDTKEHDIGPVCHIASSVDKQILHARTLQFMASSCVVAEHW